MIKGWMGKMLRVDLTAGTCMAVDLDPDELRKYIGGRGLGIHPLWLRDLGEAGYRDLETFSYDVDAPYTPEAWRGRIRASAGVGASLSPERVERFDQELAELLSTRFPGALLSVPHRVFAVLARAPRRTA